MASGGDGATRRWWNSEGAKSEGRERMAGAREADKMLKRIIQLQPVPDIEIEYTCLLDSRLLRNWKQTQHYISLEHHLR